MLSLSQTIKKKNVCLEHLEGNTQIKRIHQGMSDFLFSCDKK